MVSTFVSFCFHVRSLFRVRGRFLYPEVLVWINLPVVCMSFSEVGLDMGL